MPKSMEVKTHSRQPAGGDFDNTGQIILLIRCYNEAPVSFATILSVYIVLIVIGIFVNGASRKALQEKRLKFL